MLCSNILYLFMVLFPRSRTIVRVNSSSIRTRFDVRAGINVVSLKNDVVHNRAQWKTITDWRRKLRIVLSCSEEHSKE